MKDLTSELRIPKYIQIKKMLKEAILSGELSPHAQLPSRNEFVAQYRLSGATVSKAMDELVNEKLIYRVHGRGTFVADVKKEPLSIGLIMPHLHLPEELRYGGGYNIVPLYVQAIESEARANNANVTLYLDHADPDLQASNLERLIQQADAAVILDECPGMNRDLMLRVRDSGKPVVMLDRYLEDENISSVTSDNMRAAFETTNTLIDRQFPSVCYLGSYGGTSATRERLAGYKQAMIERGLEPEVIYTDGNPEADIARLREKIEAGNRYAIFGVGAITLDAVWQDIKAGVRDKSNIALACFDEFLTGIPEGILCVGIIQPYEELGRMSVQVLIDRLNGGQEVQKIRLPCKVGVTSVVKSTFSQVVLA